MDVLIVEPNIHRGWLWQRHIERNRGYVTCVHSQQAAIEELQDRCIDIIVLNLELESDSALAIADYAGYRRPDVRIIFVTGSTFFSDGSIFAMNANACAFLQAETPPEDLAAMVAHYGLN